MNVKWWFSHRLKVVQRCARMRQTLCPCRTVDSYHFTSSSYLSTYLTPSFTFQNSNENFSNKSSTFGSVFLHLFGRNHHSVYSYCIKWWHLFNELIITSCRGFRFSTSTHFMSSNQGQSCEFCQPLRHVLRQAIKFLPYSCHKYEHQGKTQRQIESTLEWKWLNFIASFVTHWLVEVFTCNARISRRLWLLW